MYICVCRAVSTDDIKEALKTGHAGVDELIRRTRAGTCCGACRNSLAEAIGRGIRMVDSPRPNG